MRTVSRTGVLTVALLLLVVVVTIASLVRFVLDTPDYTPLMWVSLVMYGLTMTVGEATRVDLGARRSVAPLGLAAGMATALTLAGNEGPITQDGPVLLALTTVSMGAAGVLVARTGTESVESLLQQAMARTLVIVALFLSYRGLLALQPAGQETGHLFGRGWPDAAAMVVLALVATFASFAVLRAIRPKQVGLPHRVSLLDELGDVWPLSAVTALGAVMVCLMDGLVGPVLIPLYLLPVVLMQAAVQRQAEQRRATRSTLDVLGRVTDVAGFTAPGHASRVAAMSVRMGRVFGLGERDLRDLETAALVHDIGQVGLSRPIPGGATTEVSALDQRRLALSAGGILARTEDLSRLALVVSRQAVRYRSVESLDQAPLAGRIIKVANAWDDLIGTDPDVEHRIHALQRLELAAGSEYDPAVVAALRRVLEQGGLMHPAGTGRRARTGPPPSEGDPVA